MAVVDTSMFHIRNVNIRCWTTTGPVVYMSMVCKMIGHRFEDTYVIQEIGGFFEVDDAQYCRHCGTVHAATRSN